MSDDRTIIGGPTSKQKQVWQRLQARLAQRTKRGFLTGNPTLHSIASPATGLGAELQQRHRRGEADLTHLHWLGDDTISIEEIGSLAVPLVWTLHDQWAFCGAEHYTSPPLVGETASSDDRFALGYNPSSRPSHEAGTDLNRRIWLRKRRAWRKPIEMVCPSHWLADCARRSTLMGNWPITVIPYPIDLNVWAPCDQALARALLDLPNDRPLVLFGAMGGSEDPRKGCDILLDGLQYLRRQVAGTSMEKLELVVFGQRRPSQCPDLGFPIHYCGTMHDNVSLRLLYVAADVLVIPSRQDNLPNTGLEAHACGTPVVAFATGGIVDIVDANITGALAEPFDPVSLATAIRWVLEDPERQRKLGFAARQKGKRVWDPSRISNLYAEVYHMAMERQKEADL